MTRFANAVRALSAALLTFSLAACSGGTGQERGQVSTLIDIRETVKASRAAKNAPRAQVTREVIDQIGLPLLEIEVAKRGVTGYFLEHSKRDPVMVWRANDGGQVVVRNGLVTGTRGIGNDLLSSSYAATLQGIHNGAGLAQRRYDLQNGLGSGDVLVLDCSFAKLGHETLNLYGLSYRTRHVQETCVAKTGDRITNDYWIEPQSALIRQSRQWISPEIGHFRLRFLNPSG